MKWITDYLAGRKKDKEFNSNTDAKVLIFESKTDTTQPIQLLSMTVENGSLELMAEHPGVALMIGQMSKMFLSAGAENYLEMGMTSPAHPGGFVITIQKVGQRTPHQFRREAELKCIDLQLEIDRLNDLISILDPVPPADYTGR